MDNEFIPIPEDEFIKYIFSELHAPCSIHFIDDTDKMNIRHVIELLLEIVISGFKILLNMEDDILDIFFLQNENDDIINVFNEHLSAIGINILIYEGYDTSDCSIQILKNPTNDPPYILHVKNIIDKVQNIHDVKIFFYNNENKIFIFKFIIINN